ncbi:TetR/AcrR family transcriptional regulator [Streptomyces avicenniae]|uniref:TetR/AcrR family transcriptional regulator n=1 Tax=Streptomyces avicenniae TaxID=500153 RepID=UPI000699DD29|nr:TetR/AcrR family transcriptional regulator [Streptomyces avicenniae]
MDDSGTAERRGGTRRARLRAETSAEIKSVALRLMAEGGPDAITLRAIAREMGMTAGAIYGYYATRDDLITTLIRDVYGSLADTVEAARDAVPAQDTAARLLAWAEAFRGWALANPEGFRLVYGDPVPGYQVPEGGAAPEAERRACAGIIGLVAAAWNHTEPLEPHVTWDPSDFDPHLADAAADGLPDLPPAALALGLRLWGRMHGLVSLEVYGHLRTQTRAPDKVYRAEMLALVTSLGLDAPDAAPR